MIEIGDTIVSDNLVEVKFCCDLEKCNGSCCVYGDEGAPLTEGEISILKKSYAKIKPYLTEQSIKTIEKTGCFYIDREGEYVTPLVNKEQCAYVYYENGVARCAIEKAFLEKKIKMKKPMSCYLYPVRVNKYKDFTAVNYHEWNICRDAVENGRKNNIFLYEFLEKPLIQRFGKKWYEKLKASKINK